MNKRRRGIRGQCKMGDYQILGGSKEKGTSPSMRRKLGHWWAEVVERVLLEIAGGTGP